MYKDYKFVVQHYHWTMRTYCAATLENFLPVNYAQYIRIFSIKFKFLWKLATFIRAIGTQLYCDCNQVSTTASNWNRFKLRLNHDWNPSQLQPAKKKSDKPFFRSTLLLPCWTYAPNPLPKTLSCGLSTLPMPTLSPLRLHLILALPVLNSYFLCQTSMSHAELSHPTLILF